MVFIGEHVREFSNRLQDEQWFRLVFSQSYNLSNGDRLITATFVIEFYGTEFKDRKNIESQQFDAVMLVPVLFYDIGGETPSNVSTEIPGFYPYRHGSLPVTRQAHTDIRIVPRKDELQITSKLQNFDFEIKLPATDEVAAMIIACQECGFAVPAKDGIAFARVSSTDVNSFPAFPYRKSNLLNTKGIGLDSDLTSLISHADKYPKTILARPDSYLDVNLGSSSYAVYQSTTTAESLPKPPKLGGICGACFKSETSREHCSPKWLADEYNVTPLVAPILCKQCNKWFGDNLEAPTSQILSRKVTIFTKKTHTYITFWAVKTALTMSLASGVRIQPNWLISLRERRLPDGFRVYFDPRVNLNEDGFNFGVSRFSNSLVDAKEFLFTMSTPLFTFCVVHSSTEATIPLLEIYPSFDDPPALLSGYLADMHQNIHEAMTGERTVPNDIEVRAQTRKKN